MRLIGSDIYAESSDFHEAQIPKGTIDYGVNQNRKGNTRSWVNIPDPLDGRRVLILVESIPSRTRAKLYKTYDADSLEAWAKNTAAQQLAHYIKINDHDIRYFRSLKHSNGRRYYSDAECSSMAQASAWLSFLTQLPRDKRSMRRLGFGSKRELLLAAHNLCSHVLKLKGLSKISNHRKFQDKIKAYREQGAECLVNHRFGNQNSRKLTPKAERLLRTLYKKHQKFSFVQIHEMYKDRVVVGDGGLPEISLSAVKGYLGNPTVLMQCAIERHGKGEAKNGFEFSFARRRPSYPHALWVMDGSPVELYYKDGENKRKRLYGFMVMDAATWHIVGYAYGNTETQDLVFLALRDAATRSGHLPTQLLFDNSSAIKSKDLMEWYKVFTTYCTPAQVGNAKTKIIEPAWRQFNEQCLRQYDNYGGANITAKRLDSRVNDDWLRKNKHALPNKEGVIEQYAAAVEMWNLTHPIEGESQAPKLTFDLQVSIFWKWRMKNRSTRQTYTYGQTGITIQIGKEKYPFVVYTPGGKQIDYDFWRHHAGARFNVKYDADDMDMIALYDGDNFVTYAEAVKRMPMAIADYEDGDGERIQEALQLRREFWDELDAANAADKEMELIDAEGYAKAPYPTNGKQKDRLNASLAVIKEDQIAPAPRKKAKGMFAHVVGDGSVIDEDEYEY